MVESIIAIHGFLISFRVIIQSKSVNNTPLAKVNINKVPSAFKHYPLFALRILPSTELIKHHNKHCLKIKLS